MDLKIKSKKLKIEKEIYEYEDKKSEKIMELGLSVYDKVRRGLLDESLFGELIYEIRKIDLEIYNRMLDIASIEGHDENTPVCECGYIPKQDEKFCPKCGREINREGKFMLCDACATKIDVDSKFCVCCGSKVVKKQKVDLDKYEVDEYEEDKTVYDEYEDYEIVEDEEVIVKQVENTVINEKSEDSIEELSESIDEYKEIL